LRDSEAQKLALLRAMLYHVTPLRLSNMADWIAVNDTQRQFQTTTLAYLSFCKGGVAKTASRSIEKAMKSAFITQRQLFYETLVNLQYACPEMTFNKFVKAILTPAKLDQFAVVLEQEWKYKPQKLSFV